MKKIIFFCILIFASTLFSAQLKRYYYKDYGYITRIVFVFDKKPVWHLQKKDNKIILIAEKSYPSSRINKKIFNKNRVIKEITFEQSEENIQINTSVSTGYYEKHFSLFDNGYKIVLDIFKSSKATTAEMHKSYAYFYKSIGLNKKALQHQKEYELLSKKENTIQKDSTLQISQQKIVTKRDTTDTLKSIKKIEKKISEQTVHPQKTEKKSKRNGIFSQIKYIYWVFLSFAILVIVIIVLPKRKSKLSDTDKNWFAEPEFIENLAIMLFEKGWKIPEIARELKISEDDVKKIKKKNKDIIKRKRL